MAKPMVIVDDLHIVYRVYGAGGDRGTAATATYGGNGMCYLAFGQGEVARVDVTFLKGQAPFGGYEEPSVALAADKVEFGTSRIQRWFGA